MSWHFRSKPLMQSNLSGPEFLDHVADAELNCGNIINSDAYRQRAVEWARDKQEIDELHRKLAESESRWRRVQSAVQS